MVGSVNLYSFYDSGNKGYFTKPMSSVSRGLDIYLIWYVENKMQSCRYHTLFDTSLGLMSQLKWNTCGTHLVLPKFSPEPKFKPELFGLNQTQSSVQSSEKLLN